MVRMIDMAIIFVILLLAVILHFILTGSDAALTIWMSMGIALFIFGMLLT